MNCYVRWILHGECIVAHIVTAIPLPVLVNVVVHGANPNGFVFCRSSKSFSFVCAKKFNLFFALPPVN